MSAVKTPAGDDPFSSDPFADLPLPEPDEPPAVAPEPPPRGKLRPATADDDDPIIRSSTGVIQSCEHNARILIERSKRYQGVYFDDFLQRLRIDDRDFAESDLLDLVMWLQSSTQQARFTKNQALGAITKFGNDNHRDTLIEHVEAQKFLGITDIDLAFVQGWGADDTPLHRAASRNFFIALAARAYQPGAQVDTLWAFEGPQGVGKSQALRALGGDFHAEVGANIASTDFMRELRGIWIAELAELESLRGREASTIKRLLSVPSDRFVEKYEKFAQVNKRRAVATATTNEATYWQDPTGARRLIPVRCGIIDVDLIKLCAPQWIAEGAERFKAGATWWEWPASIFEAQSERQQDDPWEDILRDGIANGRPNGTNYRDPWPEPFISSAELAERWLRLEPHQQGASMSKRIGAVMRKLGFVPTRDGKARTRGWVWAGPETIDKTFRP